LKNWPATPTFDQQLAFARATRVGKINWADLTSFASYLFPLGQTPREFPGNVSLIARNLHVEPFIGENEKLVGQSANNNYTNLATYTYARVRIDYESPQFDPQQGDDPVALLQHRWSIGGEVIQAEPGGFVWDDDGKVSDEAGIGVYVSTIEHQITWPRVEHPPFNTIRNQMGTCNSGNLNFNTGVILPETLLFIGAELQRDVLSSGNLGWQVSYRFSERRVEEAETSNPGGWNHFYRSENPDSPRLEGKTGFYRIKVAADRPNAGDPVFRLANHALLFQESA
jgi:hypothetical protein